MTPRELFQRIMHFEPADRLPLWQTEGIAEGAVRRWIVDGDVPIGIRKEDLFPFETGALVRLDTDPLPAFPPKVIADDGRWVTETDRYGFTLRRLKEQSVGPMIYAYLGGSVAGREDWEKMKRRFDPADPRRRPRDWGPEWIEHHNRSDEPLGLRIDWGPGRGIKNGYMMGFERFCQVLIEEPALLEDMFAFWADFVIELARDLVDRCRFHYVWINEDGMGFKNSSMVSPDAYRRIWARPVGKVVGFLRGRGIDVIGYLTSGNIQPLIPVLLELGVNLLLPLESAAGVDARDLRRRYGRDLLLIGNISRQALMDGPAAVEKEFAAKVPELVASGGYIPAPDDILMPDMPFAGIRRYVELVRQFKP